MWGNLAKSALEATTGQTPSKLLERIESVVAPRGNNDEEYDESEDGSESYETDSDYDDDDDDEMVVYDDEGEYNDEGDVYRKIEEEIKPKSLLGEVWNSAKNGLIETTTTSDAMNAENNVSLPSSLPFQKLLDGQQQNRHNGGDDDMLQQQEASDSQNEENSRIDAPSSNFFNGTASYSSPVFNDDYDDHQTEDQNNLVKEKAEIPNADKIVMQEETNLIEEEITVDVNDAKNPEIHEVLDNSVDDIQSIDLTSQPSSELQNSNWNDKFEKNDNESEITKNTLEMKDLTVPIENMNQYEFSKKHNNDDKINDVTDGKMGKNDPSVTIPNHTLLNNVFSTTAPLETSVVMSEDMFSTRTTIAEDDAREETLSVSEFLPPALFIFSDVDNDAMITTWLQNQYDSSLFEFHLLPPTMLLSNLYSKESLEKIQRQGKIGIYYYSKLPTMMEIQQNLPQWESFRLLTITHYANHQISSDKLGNTFHLEFSKNNDLSTTILNLASKLQDWYPQLSLNDVTLSLPKSIKALTTYEKEESEGLPPLVICGPSGVGKGTLIDMLMKHFPQQFGFSVSHTTRNPRAGEVDKVHYHFTTVHSIKNEVAQNLFIEYAIVHGNYYGTSLSAVQSVQKEGKICILDIDAQGVANVKKSMLHPYYVFISPPSMEALESRLRGRGTESEESICKRLENSKKEMEYGNTKGNFDRVFINDDLNATFNALTTQIIQWYPDLKVGKDSIATNLTANTFVETDSESTNNSNFEATKTINDKSETSFHGNDSLSHNNDQTSNAEVSYGPGDSRELLSLRTKLEKSQTVIFELEQQIKNSEQHKNDSDRLTKMEQNFIQMQKSMQMQIGKLEFELEKERKTRSSQEKSFEKKLTQANARGTNAENMIKDLRINYAKELSDTENRYKSQLKKSETNLSRAQLLLSQKQEEVNQHKKIEDDLRKMINDNQEGVDAAEEEADELHEENEKLHAQLEKKQKEVESTKIEMSRLQNENSKMLGLQMEIRMLEETLERDKRKMESVSNSLSGESNKISQERDVAKASVVDLEQQLDALRADMNIVKADYNRALSANSNLQTALEAFQSERDAEIALFKEQMASAEEANNFACEAKIEAARQTNQKLIDEVQTAANNAVKNMMGELQTMELNLEDQRKESVNLRRSLDEAISRLQRTQEDVIDRSLMKNILLDWHSKKGKARREVLELMASVLHFSQDEKDKCDIGESTGTYRKVVDAVVPPISPAKMDPSSLAGGNVREKWVNFLLSECGDESLDKQESQGIDFKDSTS